MPWESYKWVDLVFGCQKGDFKGIVFIRACWVGLARSEIRLEDRRGSNMTVIWFGVHMCRSPRSMCNSSRMIISRIKWNVTLKESGKRAEWVIQWSNTWCQKFRRAKIWFLGTLVLCWGTRASIMLRRK